MEGYQPPFTLTKKMLTRVSAIGEKLGRLSGYRDLAARPQLRRNNRIRSIHSSLAIEANSLSLDAVRGVIDGQLVIGPQCEIQEVRNAYQAYEQIGRFDPYDLRELLRLHGVMTQLTVAESGAFRRGEEGVFDGERCIFMAPPASRVSCLMADLFTWMQQEKGELHPLILSSVFHYEFVFIHPFSDGNGRMARLWQTALLADWEPLFQYLPLESRIQAFQNEYYDAISACHRQGSANIFVEFMLIKIDETLALALQQAAHPVESDSPYVQRLLTVMEYGVPYSTARLLELLHLKSRETLRRHYLTPALAAGLITMTVPDKPTSRNQAYIRKAVSPYQ